MSHRKAQNLEIDNLDIQILSILMKNATTPYTEIAKELIVSGGTIHVRMKKLEEMGVIKGASLENGLLYIELERVVPETLKPRRIEIK